MNPLFQQTLIHFPSQWVSQVLAKLCAKIQHEPAMFTSRPTMMAIRFTWHVARPGL